MPLDPVELAAALIRKPSVTPKDEGAIPLGDWIQARRLCSDVDEKDTPFIALTIHLNARLWTEDAELKRGLRAKGFDHFFEP